MPSKNNEFHVDILNKPGQIANVTHLFKELHQSKGYSCCTGRRRVYTGFLQSNTSARHGQICGGRGIEQAAGS